MRKLFVFCGGAILILLIAVIPLFTSIDSSAKEQKKTASLTIIEPEKIPQYIVSSGMVAAQMLISQEEIYCGLIEIKSGAKISSHQHQKEAEILYCLGGAGKFICGSVEYSFCAGQMAVIPPQVEHSFVVTSLENMKAFQVWSPGGPEKKYLSWEKKGSQ